jgi:hypothetical protein
MDWRFAATAPPSKQDRLWYSALQDLYRIFDQIVNTVYYTILSKLLPFGDRSTPERHTFLPGVIWRMIKLMIQKWARPVTNSFGNASVWGEVVSEPAGPRLEAAAVSPERDFARWSQARKPVAANTGRAIRAGGLFTRRCDSFVPTVRLEGIYGIPGLLHGTSHEPVDGVPLPARLLRDFDQSRSTFTLEHRHHLRRLAGSGRRNWLPAPWRAVDPCARACWRASKWFPIPSSTSRTESILNSRSSSLGNCFACFPRRICSTSRESIPLSQTIILVHSSITRSRA